MRSSGIYVNVIVGSQVKALLGHCRAAGQPFRVRTTPSVINVSP